MKACHTILLVTLLLVTLALLATGAWAQENSTQQPAEATPDSSRQLPVPGFGTQDAPPPVNENPPISGLDMPNLEPHAAPLSYLQAGAHVFESVDSNVQNTLGGSGTHTITNALGSVELQRLWRNYDLALDYLGGVGYYNAQGVGLKQIEELGVNQKINWKRGHLGVRDAFSYQPEGTFGSAYGSVATSGAALGGQSAFFGGTALGALGQVPRIMNISLVDVVENLSPKSSVTVTGGYGFVHFLGSDPTLGNSFIGNSQVSGEVGYDRLLGPHDQAAVVYGYQGFHFSTGLNFHSNVIQVMWGHRISGRMDFVIAAGPQFIQLNHVPVEVSSPTSSDCVLVGISPNLLFECPTNDSRISAAGRMSLRYQLRRISLDLNYSHYTTGGSGFFAGAESDIARLSATRQLGRRWTGFTDIGYSHNRRLLVSNCALGTPSASCPGVTANSYQYGFAGLGMRRMITRSLRVFASYQYNYLVFDSSFCQVNVPCSRTSQRHVGTIGVDWTSQPIRLD